MLFLTVVVTVSALLCLPLGYWGTGKMRPDDPIGYASLKVLGPSALVAVILGVAAWLYFPERGFAELVFAGLEGAAIGAGIGGLIAQLGPKPQWL